MPLKRRAAPRAEIMGWDGSAWQRILVESSANPNLRVAVYDGTNKMAVAAGDVGDNASMGLGSYVKAPKWAFNESRWDRWRNNTEKTVLPSGTRTFTTNSATQINWNARGAIIWVNVTAVSGTFAAGEGLTILIQGRDPVTAAFRTIGPTLGPMTTTGAREMLIYPGCTDVAGRIAVENDIPLPREWRVRCEITGTNPSFTFSVGASYIV